MFRSWRMTVLLMVAVARQRRSGRWACTCCSGFTYNVLASMLPPLVIILAIADDVHIVQHFNHELRATGSKEHAFKSRVQPPVRAAARRQRHDRARAAVAGDERRRRVRAFGIGAAVGVMVDFVMSLVFVPTLLTLVKPETGRGAAGTLVAGADAARWRGSRSATHGRAVGDGLVVIVVSRVRHRAAARRHQPHQLLRRRIIRFTSRPTLIDQELSGIYSFNILLEGPPDSMKSPDALRRMEQLRPRLEQLPFVRKVVSVADYVKRVNRELNGGDAAAAVVPASARSDRAGTVRLRPVGRGPARARARRRPATIRVRRSR